MTDVDETLPSSVVTVRIPLFVLEEHHLRLSIDRRLLHDEAGRTTDVEGTQCQLRPRFTDRLGRDDTRQLRRLSTLSAGRKVASVAQSAQTPRLDSQVSTERILMYPRRTSASMLLGHHFIDRAVPSSMTMIFCCAVIVDIFRRNTTEDAVACSGSTIFLTVL